MNNITSAKMITAALLLASASVMSFDVLAGGHETACMANVQGKIAWDPGSVDPKAKEWKQENLETLCKGVTNSNAPGQCFEKVMAGNVRWGESDKWEWKNAISLCAGADDAEKRITCFKGRIDSGEKWDTAIFQCQANNSIGNTVK